MRKILGLLYSARVPIFLIGLALWLVGLAILESEVLGARIMASLLALLVNVIQVAYAGYLAWRIWGRRVVYQNVRDRISIWAVIDSLLGLVIGWSFGSQALNALFPGKLFETHGLSENHWAAAVDWFASLTDLALTISAEFRPIHPTTRLYYAFVGYVHYIYLVAVVTIWLSRVDDDARDEVKRHDVETGQAHHHEKEEDDLVPAPVPPVHHASAQMRGPRLPPPINSAVIGGNLFPNTAAPLQPYPQQQQYYPPQQQHRQYAAPPPYYTTGSEYGGEIMYYTPPSHQD